MPESVMEMLTRVPVSRRLSIVRAPPSDSTRSEMP